MKRSKELNSSQLQLQNALLNLLSESSFEEITITKLCQEAAVSRMAYYRNYDSIQALYQEIIEDFLNEFLNQSSGLIQNQNWKIFWQEFYSYLYLHKDTVKRLLQSHQHNILLPLLNKLFVPINIQNQLYESYQIQGIIGLTYNMIVMWVDQSFRLEPNKLAELCESLIPIK